MKKLFYIMSMALAGVMATSCLDNDESLVTYDPDAVTAPVIGDLTGTTLASDGEAIALTFSPVDYGMPCARTYTLYASSSQDFDKVEKVSAKIGTDGITIAQSELNTKILNLGGAADTEFTLYLRLSAWMANDKGAGIAPTLTLSNVVSATFVPYDVLLLDKDVYGHVWVIGNYCDWNHSKTQFLYDYSKNGNTYEGVIDFADKASDGFKVTGDANWNNGNWGSVDQAEAAETGSVQLWDDGGSKDIKCYSKRFYHFTFNKTSLVLTKDWGADKIGVIGLNGDWNNDIAMEYNADYVRFYADIDVPANSEFKFRADGAWDINWGVGCAPGGDNIPVEAGQYRVYLDLNKKEITLNSAMYGKDEPTATPGEPEEPVEPVEPTGAWSVIGVNGDWETDQPMTQTAPGVWVSKLLNITSGDWKLRYDGGWDVNRGADGLSADGKVVEAVPGGNNIALTGDIIIVYNANSETIGTLVWGIVGSVASIEGFNWNNDIPMNLGEDGKFYSVPVALGVDDEFKIRKFAAWDDDRGGACEAIDAEFDVTKGGANIKVPAAGTYMVVYDPATEKITLSSAFWGLIGDFNGWGGDVFMTYDGAGKWIAYNKAFEGGWKIRQGAAWSVDRGGVFAEAAVPFEVTQGGSNITVTGLDSFDVIYDSTNETITVK